MVSQLLLSKRQFIEAMVFAKRSDPVSCGIAISLFQDAVETLVWALVKARNIYVEDASSFTANLKLLQKNGMVIPEIPKLLELNKARVGFKHYGNLPAPDEARKYQGYVEDFLRTATAAQFNQDIDALSLVDLVSFEDVRVRLKSAEVHVANNEFNEAVGEASIAKVLLFSKLSKYIPNVDRGLFDADRLFVSDRVREPHVFKYVAQYFTLLRDTSIVSLLRLSLEDYSFLNSTLLSVRQSMGGKWEIVDTRGLSYDEATCKRQISCLIEISIRLEGVA